MLKTGKAEDFYTRELQTCTLQEKLDEYKAAAAAYAAGTFRPEMNRNGKGRKPFGKGKKH